MILSRILDKAGASSAVRSVLHRAGLTMILQVCAAGLSYGSQVFLARWLGVHEFGVYIFAWSLAQPIAVAVGIGLSQACGALRSTVP